MRCLSILAVLPLTALVAAQQPASAPVEIGTLIKQLGSDDFTEREAASKRLNAIGTSALAELCEAQRCENPEVVRRAHELVRKIEYRIDNEKTLAPTLVTLDAKNQRLDAVLAELSKQAKWEVVLSGRNLNDLADQRITVSTHGQVPFWEAVLKICDTAGLHVVGAGGFAAPEAISPALRPPSPSKVRSADDMNRAVVLQPRGGSQRRPADVYGAVLVEALPFPKGTGPAHAALLQVWPEPRLGWGSASDARVSAAIDAAGERLAPEAVSMAPPKVRTTKRGELVIVRNPDGTAGTLITSETLALGGFTPNTRQAVVRFAGREKPPADLKELQVAVLGTVRTGVEPLARASKLEINQPATVSGSGGVELTVKYSKNAKGRFVAEVTLTYDSRLVQAARVGAELPGTKGGPEWDSHTVHGVRIADADGKPYYLGLISGQGLSGGSGRQVTGLTLELHPNKDGHGPPATATFWGTYVKPVEVPVVLKDVPLSKPK